MPKFYLQTFGCQMNKNDSERIVGLLCEHGFTQISEPDSADLLIVNTCSVRQSAEDRVFGLVHNWQNLREKNPNLIIAVTGCMPGRDKDGKLKNRITGADLFFGIEELPMLPKWLSGLSLIPRWGGVGVGWLPPLSKRGEGGVAEVKIDGKPPMVPLGKGDQRPNDADCDYLQITPVRPNHFQAFVTIQTGCNNFCTYCVVPQARGREKNRPVKEILEEIKKAVAGGAKEITLLGQVVNNYKAPDFATLLWEINQLPGDFKIHFTAADPQYFNDRQIEALKLPKQVNYLHLPAQSGDNEILRKMNRKYTREEYVELVKKIRAVKPDIAIGTDLIVGFCGETEEQFQNTLDLYRECDFDIAYTAQYSERSDTAAAKGFKDDVPKETKKRRWDELQALMEETAFRKNQKYVGRTVEVLVEKCEPFVIPSNSEGSLSAKDGKPPAAPLGKGGGRHDSPLGRGRGGLVVRNDTGVCSGNSSEMKLTQFLGTPDLVGQFVKIKITQAFTWVIRGERV